MYLLLIFILGFVLRLVNISKPEGLWNDEYVSWYISSTPFKQGFWQEVFEQCHMPLYYLYLKPFAGFSDTVLRLSSVIPSVASIWVMYLVGKEYSKRTGLAAALITSVLPFLVYYSQEVRFYSLLFLLTALSLLFTIKILKNNCKNNWIYWGFFSILILFTHILGGIYVLFNTIYLIYKKKFIPIKLIYTLIPACFIVGIIGLNVLQKSPSSQWWSIFGYSKILFLFSDFLSPILTNNINSPDIFFYNKTPLYLFLQTIPTLIASYGIIRGIKKENGLGIIFLSTVLVIAMLALTGKVAFITKYSIEVLPILILLMVLGFENKIEKVLLNILLLMYVGSLFTPYYPTKMERMEGNKLAANLIIKANSDFVLYTYYKPNRFKRYIPSDLKSIDLSIDKTERFNYLDNPERILKDIKIGETLSVLILDSVSFIPVNAIESSAKNNIPEMFISFSKIKYGLIKELDKNYKNYKIETSGAWTLISGKKFK